MLREAPEPWFRQEQVCLGQVLPVTRSEKHLQWFTMRISVRDLSLEPKLIVSFTQLAPCMHTEMKCPRQQQITPEHSNTPRTHCRVLPQTTENMHNSSRERVDVMTISKNVTITAPSGERDLEGIKDSSALR